MGEDFGIGFGRKFIIAVAHELIFQRLVILDDAVVDERQFSARVEMRMSVLVGRFPVRGPAGVTDAVGSGRWLLGHELAERRDPAGAFARLDAIAIHDGDARGIVTAIFQTAQPIEQDGSRLRTPDVTDDAAHDPRA